MSLRLSRVQLDGVQRRVAAVVCRPRLATAAEQEQCGGAGKASRRGIDTHRAASRDEVGESGARFVGTRAPAISIVTLSRLAC